MAYKDPAQQRAYYADWYQKNKKRHVANVVQRNREERKRVQDFIRDAKCVPCTDCGVSYPPYVMDFDHLGNKLFGVGRNGGRTLKQVKAEIAKCEVVCANCHRVRTHERAMGNSSNG